MNILVTGATGLLGSRLCERLSSEHHVYAVMRDISKSPFHSDAITPVYADLYDLDVSVLPENIDAVYYLAQSRKFRVTPGGFPDMFAVNVSSPVKLAFWAMEQGVSHYTYASTGGVYTPGDAVVFEHDPLITSRVRGFYFDGKLSTELILHNYAQYFTSLVILRPFFMYGSGQEQSMLIPRLIQSVRSGDTITLGNPDGIRVNPVHVTDAAEACGRILRISGEQTINIAGNEVQTLGEISRMIGLLVGKQPVFTVSPIKQGDLIGDNTKMRTLLHDPSVSLQEGLGSMVVT